MCKNVHPLSGVGISNSQPSAYEYPHLTTRSGLQSKYSLRFQLYNLALKGFTPLLLSTAFRYAEANFDLEEQNLFWWLGSKYFANFGVKSLQQHQVIVTKAAKNWNT